MVQAMSDQAGRDILRIEHLHAEIDALRADIAEIYRLAKKRHDDTKAMKAAVRCRKAGVDEWNEFNDKVTEYVEAARKCELGTNIATRAPARVPAAAPVHPGETLDRSEEHTSELQSLMRISYAVFCLKKKHKTSSDYNKQHHQ